MGLRTSFTGIPPASRLSPSLDSRLLQDLPRDGSWLLTFNLSQTVSPPPATQMCSSRGKWKLHAFIFSAQTLGVILPDPKIWSALTLETHQEPGPFSRSPETSGPVIIGSSVLTGHLPAWYPVPLTTILHLKSKPPFKMQVKSCLLPTGNPPVASHCRERQIQSPGCDPPGPT